MNATVKVLVSSLAALLVVGSACERTVTMGGPVNTRYYPFQGFDSIQVDSTPMGTQVWHRLIVEIVPSDTYGVSVTANQNLLDNISVRRSGSTLHIALRDVQIDFSPATLQAKVTMPQLSRLSASGAAEVTAYGFRSAQTFSLEVSGAAKADIGIEAGGFAATVNGGRASGTVKTGNATIDVFSTTGAASFDGTVEFSGSGTDLVLRGGLGAEASLSRFSVQNADVTLYGFGTRADIAMNGQLDVTLTGSVILHYSGNATLGRTIQSEGAVMRREE